MIKLSKSATPAILHAKAAEWTNAVLDKLNRGEALAQSDKTRYSHPDIKSALVMETNGKCAYCESKLRHVSHGDIEHITPKSREPRRWFDWSNLTLACQICNKHKSNAEVSDETFIDPYQVDPEPLFWFVGATLFPRPGSNAAALTERLLELNRTDLVERRYERLKGLHKLLDVIERTDNKALRSILEVDFLEEGKDDKEFAALAREMIRIARDKVLLESSATKQSA